MNRQMEQHGQFGYRVGFRTTPVNKTQNGLDYAGMVCHQRRCIVLGVGCRTIPVHKTQHELDYAGMLCHQRRGASPSR